MNMRGYCGRLEICKEGKGGDFFGKKWVGCEKMWYNILDD